MQKKFRGAIILNILEALGETAINTVDLFDAFLSAGYGATTGDMNRIILERRQGRKISSVRNEQEYKNRQRYYAMLYKLKRDGLIKEDVRGTKKLFRRTPKGAIKLKCLKDQRLKNRAVTYPVESHNSFTIVTFDIPEKQRDKRDWLRLMLRNMGLKMIQKSVWIGNIKLPEEFLNDLRNLSLLECTQIFQVTKAGSLDNTLE